MAGPDTKQLTQRQIESFRPIMKALKSPILTPKQAAAEADKIGLLVEEIGRVAWALGVAESELQQYSARVDDARAVLRPDSI